MSIDKLNQIVGGKCDEREMRKKITEEIVNCIMFGYDNNDQRKEVLIRLYGLQSVEITDNEHLPHATDVSYVTAEGVEDGFTFRLKKKEGDLFTIYTAEIVE